MERRNWPWKKKSFDKAAVEKDSTALEPSVSVASSNESGQGHKKCKYIQISDEVYYHFTGLEERIKRYGDEVKTLEDGLNDLRQKLSDSQSEVAVKDISVKQHAKVAEEAVSGWEKAEAEAVTLKNGLEAIRVCKVAAEDRATHLEGALKECMREIRTLKDDREAAVSSSRELEKLKLVLKSRIEDADKQLLRSTAENSALSRSLQERSGAFSHVCGEKSRAEAEAELLRNGLFSSEKELKSLRYELHLSSKELEIRNEEKEMSRRSADAAARLHLDSVRKIARLESECHRLSGLVRKKLPGPAAIAQMKLEVARRPGRPVETEILKAELQASRELCTKLSSRIHDLENSHVSSPRRPDTPPPTGEGRSDHPDRSIDQMGLMDDFLEMEKLAGVAEGEAGAVEKLRSKIWEIFESADGEVGKVVGDIERLVREARSGEGEAVEGCVFKEIHCPDPDSVLVFGTRVREDGCGPGPVAAGQDDDVSVGVGGRGEEFERDLRADLEAARKSNMLAETQVKCMAEAYRALEACSEEMRGEVQRLEMRAAEIEKELLEARRGRDEALSHCRDLQDELNRSPSSTAMDAGLKLKQEEELEAAAEKLAECQETIFLLRSQLKPARVTPAATCKAARSEEGYGPAEADPGFRSTSPVRSRPSNTKHGPSRSDSGSGSSSSSTSTPEKHTRKFTRFFSSKGVNGY